jgi:ribonucleoside-diphosphate reductase alpha chain
LVDAASRRQKWIDQAQSLNLYIAGASGKKLDITYRMAWLSGLKTTYYLRALSATSTEKSTLEKGTLNAVSSGADVAAAQQAAAPQPAAPVAAQEPVAQQAPVQPQTGAMDIDLGEAAPVPMACSLDDPDCEACQ